MQWASFAVELTTGQGFPLIAGGICRSGTAGYWKERFRALASLQVAGGAYSIDHDLAEALRGLADKTLTVAGCTLDTRLPLTLGVRTGGVLGCPHMTAESAQDVCEALPHDFSLYTTAGGPGLAALAGPEATQKAITNIQALRLNASIVEMTHCLFSSGLETFLFVSDGTGSDARGCLIAASFDSVTAVGLGNPL